MSWKDRVGQLLPPLLHHPERVADRRPMCILYDCVFVGEVRHGHMAQLGQVPGRVGELLLEGQSRR